MAANPQPPVTKRAGRQSAWKALSSHCKTVSKLHLRQLFADDSTRGQRMSLDAVGLYFDYSKNRVTDETLKLLLQLAEELLRRPDLHDVPRQLAVVHPDLPWRQGRGVSDG